MRTLHSHQLANKIKRLTYLFLFFLGGFTTQAQTVKRIELPTPANNQPYHTVSLGSKGILLISQLSKNAFNIQRFTSDLDRAWSINGTIEDNLDFVKSSYDGQSVYLLFSRQRTDFYQVVKVGLAGFTETFYLTAIERFEITDFQTLGYSVFMAGTVKEEPMLLFTNLSSKQSRVLPGATQNNTVIQSVDVDTTNRLVNVCYAVRKNKEIKIISRSFDEFGQMLHQVLIEPEPDYSLLNGRLFMLNDSTKLMIGTYGFRNMQGGNNSGAAQGLYLSKIVYNEVDFTQYHSFTDFKNFFNFMKERDRERMERRIERKKESGDDVKLNYRLLVHDIIEQDGKYLISGEVFYPEYKNNNMGPYGMNSWWGSPLMMRSPMMWGMYPGFGLYNPYLWDPWFNSRRYNNGQVFNGFVYTHAIVAGFDEKGNMLWDNSLPFDNVRDMELREKIRVRANDDNTLAMFYSNKGHIKAKVFEQNKVLADIQPIPITGADAADKVRQTTTDEVLFWYDNYYLAYGYQRIMGEDGRRNVFYINKISF